MRLELYYAPDLLSGPWNEGFDPLQIEALLLRLKELKGTIYYIRDASKWSWEDAERAYIELAVPPSVRKRYRIRKVFGTNTAAGSFFGKGIPALVVFEGESPIDVYPHEEPGGRLITIRGYLEELVWGKKKIEGKPPPGGSELIERMDELRQAIGPIGISTAELIREGRRR